MPKLCSNKKCDSVQFVKKPNKHKSYIKFDTDEKTGEIIPANSKGRDMSYMGSHDIDLMNNTINQTVNIFLKGGEINESKKLVINAALAAIVEVDPQDSTELMLATQMVAVHNIAMEMARRALLSDQTFDGVNLNINCMTKLMRTYTSQIEALTRYRNKGKQQITVKHQNVNVNDGGQALVGDVNQGGGNG